MDEEREAPLDELDAIDDDEIEMALGDGASSSKTVHAGARVDLFPYLIRPTATLLYNFTTTQGYLSDDAWVKLELPDLGRRIRAADRMR